MITATLLLLCSAAIDYPVEMVPYHAVQVQSGFWASRLETNRTVTVPFDFQRCEETGRIANFAVAGGLEEGTFRGIFFDDSDVFKVIEGASYVLKLHPNPALETYLDELIAKIAAAQEDDGYLYTYRTINQRDPEKVEKDKNLRDGRWVHLEYNHELYNVGHLYEAAVAHYDATGKRTLLDVALKNADLICSVFNEAGRLDVPGHEEIELALVKLFRVTGDEKYLRQARFFLDMRGNPRRARLYGATLQDHAPVTNQHEAVGHAVRAGYLYAGMTDVAAMTGDPEYGRALDALWEDVEGRKMSITGGVGARREGETFGDAYELPNAAAYNETCAVIAQALWNQRMFRRAPDAKYFDVIERILYNGFLSGVGLSGDRFFYPNPLESDGETKFNHGSAERQPWFGTSCCPTNVVRFLPSMLGYVYARQENTLYLNLFMKSTTEFEHAGTHLRVEQTTNYPWDGEVRIKIEPQAPVKFPLLLRIPGWARNQPFPSELYKPLQESDAQPQVLVNGTAATAPLEHGYLRIDREWNSSDIITISLPMPVRRMLADERVADTRGKVALERGPLVYCVEGVDVAGDAREVVLEDEVELTPHFQPDLSGGITVLKGADITAIPYYAWGHRGPQTMAVWLARKAEAVRPAPVPNAAK